MRKKNKIFFFSIDLAGRLRAQFAADGPTFHCITRSENCQAKTLAKKYQKFLLKLTLFPIAIVKKISIIISVKRLGQASLNRADGRIRKPW